MTETRDETRKAQLDYACAAMKVALASFLEICEAERKADDGLRYALEYAMSAVERVRG